MGLKYIKQRLVTAEYRITLPGPVKSVLYPNEQYNEDEIYWSIDREFNHIVVSKQVLKDYESGLTGLFEVYESGGSVSVVVPEKVREKFGISQGDDLYLIAPEGVTNVKPSTFIWTFEKVESILLSGDDEDLGDFPKIPEF